MIVHLCRERPPRRSEHCVRSLFGSTRNGTEAVPYSALVAVVLLAAADCSAQTPHDSEPTGGAVREKWQATYKTIAESIVMQHGKTTLKFVEQPLRFYTNPVRSNDQHGAIFLWTEEGRPAVIGSIWSALNLQNAAVRFVTHEWLSLLEDPDVTATRDGRRLWTSGEAGIAWEPLSGAPPAAASRPARLVQMRAIARRYSATIRTQGESELRLMEQPLFRYAEGTAGIVDGAIFDFAMTTDPELLLLVEARETAGKRTWQVAFARFGNKAMTVKEGDRTVWSCEQGSPGFSDGKYYLRWRAEEMAAER